VASIVLLSGDPGNGKSFCGTVLKSLDCFDAVLHTDEIYVGYIFTKKSDLYRDDLRQDILNHYLQNSKVIGEEWHAHLFEVVTRDAKRIKRLLVEGWQLYDSREELAKKLEAAGHKVITVLASAGRYFPNLPPSYSVLELAEWIRPQLAE
jgi:hypothetical protein